MILFLSMTERYMIFIAALWNNKQWHIRPQDMATQAVYVFKVKTDVQKSKTITHCNEVTFQPVIIFHSFINSSIFPLYFHFGMVNIWILSRRVISPDDAILDILSSHTNFQSNLVEVREKKQPMSFWQFQVMFQLNALLSEKALHLYTNCQVEFKNSCLPEI